MCGYDSDCHQQSARKILEETGPVIVLLDDMAVCGGGKYIYI